MENIYGNMVWERQERRFQSTTVPWFGKIEEHIFLSSIWNDVITVKWDVESRLSVAFHSLIIKAEVLSTEMAGKEVRIDGNIDDF